MSLTIKNIPVSLQSKAYELCTDIFKTPEFEELVKDYPDFDHVHLEEIVAEFDYDLSDARRALEKDLNGIYDNWDDYVKDEVEKQVKPYTASDAWELVMCYFDYDRYGAAIEDSRLCVQHPTDWKVAVFHLS